MKNLFSFLILTLLLSTTAWAQKKVAMVKLLKGEVDVLTLGKTSKLKVDDWVEDGSVVKTGEKSFVKLVFIDKSQMNIGPSSEMKIEKFGEKDSGVIDLVKGKIRSQVTKDYLQMDRNKSKLFIKTQNAVMGVRGTDFLISTNGQTTSTVLFEGAISFNKLENRGEVNTNRLEDIVDRGVDIRPGEFSVADQIHPLPTVPAVLNVQQREALEKNQSFESSRNPGNSSASLTDKSVVPPGLSGSAVSNDASTLKTEIAMAVTKPADAPSASDALGYVTPEGIKPTNGSYLHVDSGVIIPPPPGSSYDSVTNTYIPTGTVGTVSTTGDYVPPQNVEITADGKVLVATTDPTTGQTVVTETTAPAPVTSSPTVISSTTPTTTFLPPPPTSDTTKSGTTTTTTAPLPTTNPYDSANQASKDLQYSNQTEASTKTKLTITVGQ